MHPPYRLSGIGSALVRSCEAEAAKLQFPLLWLYTERAERFYAALGWTTAETGIWKGERIAIMIRKLRTREAT